MRHLLHKAAKLGNWNVDGTQHGMPLPGSLQIRDFLIQLGPYSRGLGKTCAILGEVAERVPTLSENTDIIVVLNSWLREIYHQEARQLGAKTMKPKEFRAYVLYAAESGRKLVVLSDEVSRAELGDEWNHPCILWKAGWEPSGPMPVPPSGNADLDVNASSLLLVHA